MCLQPFSTSDHCMQSLNLFVELAQSEQRSNIFFRNFSNADYSSFDNWLSSIDWNLVLQSSDNFEKSLNTFLQFIETGVAKFVPIKENKNFNKKSNTKYPANIKELQIKNKFLWRKRFYGNNFNNYKKTSINCKNAIEKFYAGKEFNLIKGNSKIFKHVNRKLRSHNTIPNLNSNGQIIESDKEKAQNFISVFKTAFTLNDGFFPLLPDKCSPSDIQPDFSTNTIRKCLLNINSTASAGPNSLPSKFCHSLNSSFAQPLSVMFKKSFRTDILPDCWKKSIVSPVYKKRDPTFATN